LNCQPPTTLSVVGPGRITSMLFVNASFGTNYAIGAFAVPHGGQLTVGKRGGRKPLSQMDDSEKAVRA
jgi:hypothetical protein